MCSASSCFEGHRAADARRARPGSARAGDDPLGEVGQADLGAFGEDRGALDGVPQLAEVARARRGGPGRRGPRG